MISLDLTLIREPVSGEYLKRLFELLQEYINLMPSLNNMKFYTMTETGAVTRTMKHNLTFIPKDVIILSVNPSTSTVTFQPESFTKDTISYTTTGACVIRALIGSYSEGV